MIPRDRARAGDIPVRLSTYETPGGYLYLIDRDGRLGPGRPVPPPHPVQPRRWAVWLVAAPFMALAAWIGLIALAAFLRGLGR